MAHWVEDRRTAWSLLFRTFLASMLIHFRLQGIPGYKLIASTEAGGAAPSPQNLAFQAGECSLVSRKFEKHKLNPPFPIAALLYCATHPRWPFWIQEVVAMLNGYVYSNSMDRNLKGTTFHSDPLSQYKIDQTHLQRSKQHRSSRDLVGLCGPTRAWCSRCQRCLCLRCLS